MRAGDRVEWLGRTWTVKSVVHRAETAVRLEEVSVLLVPASGRKRRIDLLVADWLPM